MLKFASNQSHLIHMLYDPKAVSDWEDDDDRELPPKRVLVVWRSEPMKRIIQCLDRLAYIRANGRIAKENVRRVLERHGERAPDAEEVEKWTPPKNVPIDAFSTDYINLLGRCFIEDVSSAAINLEALANEMIRGVFGENPMSYAMIQKGSFGSQPNQETSGSTNLGKRHRDPTDMEAEATGCVGFIQFCLTVGFTALD